MFFAVFVDFQPKIGRRKAVQTTVFGGMVAVDFLKGKILVKRKMGCLLFLNYAVKALSFWSMLTSSRLFILFFLFDFRNTIYALCVLSMIAFLNLFFILFRFRWFLNFFFLFFLNFRDISYFAWRINTIFTSNSRSMFAFDIWRFRVISFFGRSEFNYWSLF